MGWASGRFPGASPATPSACEYPHPALPGPPTWVPQKGPQARQILPFPLVALVAVSAFPISWIGSSTL